MAPTNKFYYSLIALFLTPLILCASLQSSAFADTLKITLVARQCSDYSDVMANRVRNNQAESLEPLGPDSNYTANQAVAVDKELDVASQRDNCTALNGWTFTLGQGVSSSKDSGSYGKLSKVARRIRTAGPTRNNVPLFDENGKNTGLKIDGAVTVNLNNSERELARDGELTIQGGVPGNPLNGDSTLGFATLRCGLDNGASTNVKTADFPRSAEHILCYAYYVEAAPRAGQIIIQKRVSGAPTSDTNPRFTFSGNLSYRSSGEFFLRGSQRRSFERAGLQSGDSPWTVSEDLSAMPENYEFTSLTCTVTGSGGTSVQVTNAQAEIDLRAGDTVTCSYLNTYMPPAAEANVCPVLECTARNSATDYEAYFGYISRELVTVSVPVGRLNAISPAPVNRGQPYSFLPGSNTRAFSVSTDGSTLTWNLTGKSATSTSSSRERCSPSCVLPPSESVGQCDPSIVINGGNSGTLNNNGSLSSFTWSTNCPGTLQDTNTLTPTLVVNYASVPSGGTTCSVNLTVVDDTSFGGSTFGELQRKQCSTQVSISACQTDCAGIPNGTTQIDECGVCGGDNSTCLDCAGTPNGGLQIDECGVCGGDNSTCADCAGIPNGSATEDSCGICGGDGSSCSGGGGGPSACSGDFDSCGVCNGDNSTCLDCAGIPNGGTKVDNCGVCGGDGSSCGTCFSKPAVSSSQRQKARAFLSEVNQLVATAKKYSREAIACNPAGSQQLEVSIVALQKELQAILDSIRDSYLTPDTFCSNGDCKVISMVGVKAALRLIVTSVRDISIDAQRIVAGCRAPIGGPKKPSTKQFAQGILNQIASLPAEVTACEGEPD